MSSFFGHGAHDPSRRPSGGTNGRPPPLPPRQSSPVSTTGRRLPPPLPPGPKPALPDQRRRLPPPVPPAVPAVPPMPTATLSAPPPVPAPPTRMSPPKPPALLTSIGPLPTPPNFNTGYTGNGGNYGPPPIPPRIGTQSAQSAGPGSGSQAPEASNPPPLAQNNVNNQIHHIQAPQVQPGHIGYPAQVHQVQPVQPVPLVQPDHSTQHQLYDQPSQASQPAGHIEPVQQQHNWEAVEDGDPDEPPPPPYSETAANGEQSLNELHDTSPQAPQSPHVPVVPTPQPATQTFPTPHLAPVTHAPQFYHDPLSPHSPNVQSPISPIQPVHHFGGMTQPLPPVPQLGQAQQGQPEGRRLGYLNSANRQQHWSESLPPIDRR
ncbi:hypothetical protein A1Q1_03719 [Trichosporon asahii var. asahii CBS 2479]|uniref:Uncharacterized protein n=1 Tax=Trichosporon asahii var. asahii (strain ATCC 90039 / CBS 2479 / JCM 2466 / KCTC 7840 / NBRC 103889/ NCYC 2677 / UAMH 7654) TaxID=1186058 RepID=J6ESF8_TRIAS|nr:hypothetical protein A1Q1_03719 [Trichosporon asahii var. asahii CBS 2479]EJT47464.1 hypothetical protein A1Q1_03719 [Trichosporon asahii var. asahii CBS 2479]